MPSLSSLRIIFMGTPAFAVPSLEALVRAGCQIVGVITAPDRPAGRGRQPKYSDVKECALAHNLRVLQPEKLKSPAFLKELKLLAADLQIVVAFRMLPEVVWSMPPLGTFNLHASLLPQYRGAAPINHAIINGETETGLTTFFLQHEIDTGPLIFQEKEPIYANDNAGTLYERLMKKGSSLIVKTVKAIANGSAPAVPQQVPEEINHAPKIFKPDCKVDFNQSSQKVHNFIRGLSPYPAAWAKINGKTYKILRTTYNLTSAQNEQRKAGILQITDNENNGHIEAQITTNDGYIVILELQPEGKKPMKTVDFLRGNKF